MVRLVKTRRVLIASTLALLLLAPTAAYAAVNWQQPYATAWECVDAYTSLAPMRSFGGGVGGMDVQSEVKAVRVLTLPGGIVWYCAVGINQAPYHIQSALLLYKWVDGYGWVTVLDTGTIWNTWWTWDVQERYSWFDAAPWGPGTYGEYGGGYVNFGDQPCCWYGGFIWSGNQWFDF